MAEVHRLGGIVRLGNPQAKADALRELAAIKLEKAITLALEGEHPITDSARRRLTKLLAGTK
jgi:hypothetical protein